MAPLQVQLLGGFNLLCHGEPLPAIPSRAGRTLFAYLVVNRGVRHPRERLASEFWPDLPESRARRRLSHTLWQIQDALSALGDDQPCLDVTPDALSFDPDVPYWLDVEEFERRVERFRPVRGSHRRRRASDRLELAAAVELYRGEFMSGYYDDWVLLEQERLSQLHLDALGWLVELAKGEGAYEDALSFAKRLTQIEPLREDAHREVMRLCVLLGRTSDALRQYERCRNVLATQLGTAPAQTTTKLYERISRQRDTSADHLTPEAFEPPADEMPLVARDRERAAMVEVLDRALAGHGGTIFIEGDAGVGKSRLAAEGADDAQWRGFTVLYGACSTAGARRPYAALVEALDPELSPVRLEQLRHRVNEVLLLDLARLLPSIRRALGPRAHAPPRLREVEGAQRMREGFAQTLVGLGNINPAVLIIEDVHEADPETLRVLELAAEGLLDETLVLVITYRAEDARNRPDVWSALRTLDRRTRPQRLVLEPLSAYGTAELARSLLRPTPVDATFITELQGSTGGNPLFVLETLRALREQGQEWGAGHSQLPLTGGVLEVVGTRLKRLTPDVRHVLDHVAVHGAEAELEVLARACARSRADVADAMDDLLRRGLLTPTNDGYRFRHDVVRRVVLDELDEERARVAHRRIGEALSELHPDRVEELAHHAVEAGDAAPAMRYLRAAGQRAIEVHAYETAHEHLTRAAQLLSQTPSSIAFRFDLLADLEQVLAVLGKREEQGAVLEELTALGVGDVGRAADAARRRALHGAHTDRFHAAEQAGREAVQLAEQLPDRAVLGDALVSLGLVLQWEGRYQEALPVFERAAHALTATGASAAEAWYGRGVGLRILQHHDAAARELERARAAFDDGGDAAGEAQALGQLAATWMETGDVERARVTFEQAVDRSRAIGFRFAEAMNLMNLANLHYVTGQIGQALAVYQSANEAFRTLGQRRGKATVRANMAFVRHAVLGQDEVARREAETALEYFVELGDGRWAAQCLSTLAGISLRQHRLNAMDRQCQRARELAVAAGDVRIEAEVRGLLAARELERGLRLDALEHVEAAVSLCREGGFTELLAHLTGLQGWIRQQLGDVDGAVAAAHEARTLLGPGTERPYLVNLFVYRTLKNVGDHAGAQEALEAANSSLESHLADVDEALREEALTAVPEHEEIVSAWYRSQPREVRVFWTDARTPTGRPLTDEDRIEVSLTLEADQTADPGDRVALRRQLIHRLAAQGSKQGALPTIEDLADILDVSAATIRRDLRALRERGVTVATRGSRAS